MRTIVMILALVVCCPAVLMARPPRALYDVWTTYAYDPVFPHSTPPDGKAAIVRTEAPEAETRSFAKAVLLRGAVGEYEAMALHVRSRVRGAWDRSAWGRYTGE